MECENSIESLCGNKPGLFAKLPNDILRIIIGLSKYSLNNKKIKSLIYSKRKTYKTDGEYHEIYPVSAIDAPLIKLTMTCRFFKKYIPMFRRMFMEKYWKKIECGITDNTINCRMNSIFSNESKRSKNHKISQQLEKKETFKTKINDAIPILTDIIFREIVLDESIKSYRIALKLNCYSKINGINIKKLLTEKDVRAFKKISQRIRVILSERKFSKFIRLHYHRENDDYVFMYYYGRY